MTNETATNQSSRVMLKAELARELPRLAAGYSSVFIIAGQTTAGHWLQEIQTVLGKDSNALVFESGEHSKNLKTVEHLCRQLRSLGCDRKSLIISLGGGVSSDIAGFVAASYMRGVAWIAVPTTVLAQADAAIGGKTGVNLNGYKNMVGSFYPPKAVLINSKFLTTLDKKYIREGLAEIIKMGFVCDKTILDALDQIPAGQLPSPQLNAAIERAARAKLKIVNQDFRENGQRKLLNFGHTIGHAVETLSLTSARPLLHGEAVAIGMLAEAKLAELEKLYAGNLSDQIRAYCQKFAINTEFQIKPETILKTIASDKKNSGTRINWTLPVAPGKGVFNHKASPANIKQAITFITR